MKKFSEIDVYLTKINSEIAISKRAIDKINEELSKIKQDIESNKNESDEHFFNV